MKLWKRPRKGQVVTLKDVHGSLSIIHTKSIPSGCVRQADRQGSVYADIQYADFMDLVDIITRRDNWREAFQSIFRRSKRYRGVTSPIAPCTETRSHIVALLVAPMY